MASMADMVDLVRKQRDLQGQESARMPMGVAIGQRAGPGTLSVLDQGNGGTVEGNVAAINRQIEALRSLREARNPGVTTGGMVAAVPAPSFSAFDRPGDGRGDREMRQNRYESMVEDAMTGSGLSRGQRMGLLQGAQSLVMPGIESMQQQNAWAQNQAVQNTGLAKGLLEAQQSAHQLAAQQQQFGLDRDRLTVDRQNQEFQRQLSRDQLAAQTAQQQNLAAYQQGQLALGREDNAIKRLQAENKAPVLSQYEQTMQSGLAKQQLDTQVKHKEVAANLGDLFGKLDRLDQLTEISGFMGPSLAVASRVVGGDRAAKAEEFKSLTNGIAASLVKQLPGPLSEKELQFIKDQTAQLSNTPEGNRRITQSLREIALRSAQGAGVDVSQFMPQQQQQQQQQQQPAGGMAAATRELINRRGMELMTQGMSKEQAKAQLRKEGYSVD